MTRKTRRMLAYSVAAAVLGIVPVVVALVWTHAVAIERAEAGLADVAERTADRVRTIFWEAEGVLASVAYQAGHDGCDDLLITEFRGRASTLDWMLGMAFITRDDRLDCTSYGNIEPPIRVASGDVAFITPPGSAVSFTTPIMSDYMPGRAIVIGHELEKGRHAGAWIVVLVPPQALLASVAAEDVGAKGRVRVIMEDAILAETGGPEADAGDRLETVREVGLFDAEVVVSADRDWAVASWRAGLPLTIGIGAAAGLVLVGGAAHLATRRPSLNDELLDAIENGEFEVFYQPVIDLQANRCNGGEALIRWRHPQRGLVPPDLFIGMAEDSGAIVPMTRWLLADIAKTLGDRLSREPTLHVAINLAPVHFRSLDVIDDVNAVIREFGLSPEQLLFEVTERGLVDAAMCQKVIDALGGVGARVAIDDFGTGYSSLAYIQKFRLDYLKIDQAFVKTIGTDAPSAGLAQVIIEMAANLNLRIIAEGVETAEQAEYLRVRGVQSAQGWYYAKPLPAEAFLAFVDDFNRAGSGRRAHAGLAS